MIFLIIILLLKLKIICFGLDKTFHLQCFILLSLVKENVDDFLNCQKWEIKHLILDITKQSIYIFEKQCFLFFVCLF